MPRIFEDFNEDKYKNAWRNSIHAALGVNRAIKGGRLIMPLTGCKRFKAIWANMRNGMQFCTRTLYLHNTKGPLAVRMPLNALTRIKALNALKAKGIALSSLQVELLTASQAVHIRWHNLLWPTTGFEKNQVTQNWRHEHHMACENGTIPGRNMRSGWKKFVNQSDKFGNTSIGNRNGTGNKVPV